LFPLSARSAARQRERPVERFAPPRFVNKMKKILIIVGAIVLILLALWITTPFLFRNHINKKTVLENYEHSLGMFVVMKQLWAILLK
jgi:flagellar basal body-associated protein FliL